VDEDDEQIIQCLKHVRAQLVLPILPIFSLYGIMTLPSQVIQDLSLMKARTHKQAVEVVQGSCVAELEADNAKLLVELEQARMSLTEADAARNSLSVSHEKLEEECTRLHAAVSMLKQEKEQIVTDREADVVAEQKKIRDYRIGHRMRLHELHVNLEKNSE
jgi:sulfur carrier protein ThiS